MKPEQDLDNYSVGYTPHINHRKLGWEMVGVSSPVSFYAPDWVSWLSIQVSAS